VSVIQLRRQILESADVVCATLSGAGSQALLEISMSSPTFTFDAVIIGTSFRLATGIICVVIYVYSGSYCFRRGLPER
jgi:hypothetical protein